MEDLERQEKNRHDLPYLRAYSLFSSDAFTEKGLRFGTVTFRSRFSAVFYFLQWVRGKISTVPEGGSRKIFTIIPHPAPSCLEKFNRWFSEMTFAFFSSFAVGADCTNSKSDLEIIFDHKLKKYKKKHFSIVCSIKKLIISCYF